MKKNLLARKHLLIYQAWETSQKICLLKLKELSQQLMSSTKMSQMKGDIINIEAPMEKNQSIHGLEKGLGIWNKPGIRRMLLILL